MNADALRANLSARPTEELVTILRNRDADEWRPEVFDIVAAILLSRGVSIVDVTRRGEEGVELVDHRPLASIGRYVTAAEAHVARLSLESTGIEAWIDGDFAVGAGAVVLRVSQDDEAAAREVLASEPVPAGDLPPELAEPPCPTCGSALVTSVTEPGDQETPVFAHNRAYRPRRWVYACSACGHRWNDET